MSDKAAGKRLRALVETHTSTEDGWTLRLASEIGVSKSALMAWLAGTQEPSMSSCREIARVCGVRRYEVVKAWDGD